VAIRLPSGGRISNPLLLARLKRENLCAAGKNRTTNRPIYRFARDHLRHCDGRTEGDFKTENRVCTDKHAFRWRANRHNLKLKQAAGRAGCGGDIG